MMGGIKEVMLIMTSIAGGVTLTFLLGTFFSYSLVGSPDHSVAEVLLQSTAVLAFLVAFGAAEREKPVWELVGRDWTVLKHPVAYAAVAGVALGSMDVASGHPHVGFTGAFLAWLAGLWETHGVEPTAYPPTVVELILVSTFLICGHIREQLYFISSI
jgi:dolichyl-diphosphooligosaccharide--protein glycosyltransferase